MSWFGRLSLRGKLLTVFAPVVVGMLVHLVVALDSASTHRSAHDSARRAVHSVDLVEDAKSAVDEAIGAYYAFLLTGDAAQTRRYTEALASARTALDELILLSRGHPDQTQRWTAIRGALDTWQAEAGELGITLRLAVDGDAATENDLVEWAATAGGAELQQIEDQFAAALSNERDLLVARNETLASANRRIDMIQLVGGASVLVFVGAAVVVLGRSLTGSIGRLVHAAQSLADGDLTTRLPSGGSEELSRTAATFNLMAERLQATLREMEAATATARQREEQYRALFVDADRQARELALLDAIRTALAREMDLSDIIRTVVDATHSVLGYTHVSVYSLDDDELALRYHIGYDRVIDRVEIGRGVIGRVARTGKAELIDDSRREPEFLAAIDGILSEVCIPLIDVDRIVGVLNVETVGDRRLGPADLEIIETIGTQLEIAIERARLFACVRDGEARFRSLIQHASDAIGILDSEHRLIFASPAVERILGFAPAELVGAGVDLVHPDDLPDARRHVRHIASKPGSHGSFSARLRHKDGRYRHLELVATNLCDDSAVRGVVYNVRDVTERVQVELDRERQYAAIDRARAEADAILDAADEAMVLISPDGAIARVNRRFLEFFGMTWADVAGRSIRCPVLAIHRVFDEPNRFANMIDELLVDGKTGRSELLVQVIPHRRELDAMTATVAGPAGGLLGYLATFRDVTHQRVIDRMKTEFVSLASHELRTPLTSIRGYVELLRDEEAGQLAGHQREFLDIVAGNVRRLITLTNDLLDISRAESGRLSLTRGAVDLGAIVRDVAAELRPLLQERRQSLNVEIAVGIPPIDGDAVRLAQVVSNLLSNAHKYSPVGGPLQVTLDQDGESLCLAVHDNGIGISPEDQSRLFSKFFRARNRPTDEAGGTGLGLAICQSLVEMHGGVITVESEPGIGSTFTVTLPISASAVDLMPTDNAPEAGVSISHSHVRNDDRPSDFGREKDQDDGSSGATRDLISFVTAMRSQR